jgi:hypothetical protein
VKLPDDFVGIRGLAVDEQQDAVLQHALPHLRFGVVYVHFRNDFGVSVCKSR